MSFFDRLLRLQHFGLPLALTLLFLACTPLPPAYQAAAPAVPSRAADTDARGFYYQPAGLADDYPEESTTVAGIRRDLELLRQIGARYYRFAIGWDGVETAPGEYRWRYWDDLVRLAPAYSITLLPYVCYTPAWANAGGDDHWRQPPADPQTFGAFMHAVASRYRGKIASWELWNEPDIENYWLGSAAEFAAMVREGARQVRRADPQALVVLGGMAKGRSPFLEELLREHRLGVAFDVINVHGYLETWDPQPAEEYPERLQAVRDLAEAEAPGADLWLAEFGYSDERLDERRVSEWVEAVYAYEHTPAYQAVALWKHHVLAAASEDVSLTTWYRLRDLPAAEGVIGDDNNKHLGLLDAAGRPKPSFHAFGHYNRVFDLPFRLGRAAVARAEGSQSEVFAFQESDGGWIVVAWLRSSRPEEIKVKTGLAEDRRSETVAVRLPLAGPARWRSTRATGEVRDSGVLPAGAALEGIRLTGDGIFIAEVSPLASREN